MLRKQTMWLLTMLTLVIVLSVYYVTNPDMGTNMVQKGGTEEAKETNAKNNMTVKEGTSAELTQLRLKINEERDALKEQLWAMAGAKDITADKRNELFEKSEQLATLSQKETTIEAAVKTQGYKDVLVRAEDNAVQVYVVSKDSKDHSTKKANEIIKTVQKELGQKDVAVQFQVPKQ